MAGSRRGASVVFVAAGVAALVGCSDGSLPPSSLGTGTAVTEASAPTSDLVGVTVDLDAMTRPFDRRLLGTNVPAWLGADLLADAGFIATTIDSGATVLRMPGGSWSNSYDWAGCELGDSVTCSLPGAARPTDFVDFVQATGIPSMWTLSVNATAQNAAAAVAFFNGDVEDDRDIGVDRNGVGWGTVGFWAQVRASAGNPDPLAIELWEFGNEVYGGRPEVGGAECADFGWEDAWTCDGTAYVLGDDEHDGYLAVRDAMLAVDPTVELGAVGVADPRSWSDWGNEVIDAAGDELDFYSVHQYGFDESPADDEALHRPAELWPDVLGDVHASVGRDVPIAVTEYNLVSVEAGDTDKSMTRTINALYLADSIGQLALSGASLANQWNLANGTTSSGTDYGMVDVERGTTFPQYDAMRLWSTAGSELLDTVLDSDEVHAYATRHEDGHVTLLFVNLADAPIEAAVKLVGDRLGPATATVSGAYTDDLTASRMISVAETPLDVADGSLVVSLPAWSIIVLEVER